MVNTFPLVLIFLALERIHQIRQFQTYLAEIEGE